MDFELYYGQFLDDFYSADKNKKQKMVESRPSERFSLEDQAVLCASIDALTSLYALDKPEWINDSRFVLQVPLYGLNTKNKAFQKFLRETSLEEFKKRNIFYGDNVLKRV